MFGRSKNVAFPWPSSAPQSCKQPPCIADLAHLSMGPCLGPLFGGWIAYKTHQWRWIYWVLFIVVGVVFLTTLFTPETLGVVLLKRKAAKKNKEEKTDIYVTEHQLNHVPFAVSLKAGMIRPFQLMFLEPIILLMSFL